MICEQLTFHSVNYQEVFKVAFPCGKRQVKSAANCNNNDNSNSDDSEEKEKEWKAKISANAFNKEVEIKMVLDENNEKIYVPADAEFLKAVTNYVIEVNDDFFNCFCIANKVGQSDVDESDELLDYELDAQDVNSNLEAQLYSNYDASPAKKKQRLSNIQ